jgi:colanic acid/amylovoran biosynthesis glycosyltransferase
VKTVACANRRVQEIISKRAAEAGIEVRTTLVHCGVDTARLVYRSSHATAAPAHLVTVGRLIATKGYLTILEAAATVLTRDRSVRWTLVGDGPLAAEIVNDARFVELSPRLELAGALDHEAALELISRATAFVLPCEEGARGESDGIPVALMEAMALGVPIVTTLVGGISELVIPMRTGFVVPPRDGPALAAAITSLLYHREPSELERIRRTARLMVEEQFDLQRQAEVLLEILDPSGKSS